MRRSYSVRREYKRIWSEYLFASKRIKWLYSLVSHRSESANFVCETNLDWKRIFASSEYLAKCSEYFVMGTEYCQNKLKSPRSTAYCYCPLYTVHCPLPTVHCPLSTAHCSLSTAHCLLPNGYCKLPTVYCPLPTVTGYCPQFTFHCSLSIVHCPLSNAHRPLPTVYAVQC